MPSSGYGRVQIAELMATQNALTAMVREWDERLARTPPNRPARLLDAIGARSSCF